MADYEPLDLDFKRPDSYVVSLRLNAEESRVLGDEARRADEKLSTMIKELAFEAVGLRNLTRSGRVLIAAGDEGVEVRMHVVGPGSHVETTGALRAIDYALRVSA